MKFLAFAVAVEGGLGLDARTVITQLSAAWAQRAGVDKKLAHRLFTMRVVMAAKRFVAEQLYTHYTQSKLLPPE